MTKSRLALILSLLVFLLGGAGHAVAEDKTFTFLVTSDSHYEAVEKVERNDRNRLTIDPAVFTDTLRAEVAALSG